MVSKTLRILLPPVISALAIAGTATGDSFTNGSFEHATVDPGSGYVTLGAGSTAITGWTVGGDSIDYVGGYWQAENGARSIDLSGNAAGSISQTFDTVAGKAYDVNFWLAGNPNGGPQTKGVTVSASGATPQTDDFTLQPTDTLGHMGYQPYSYMFNAASNSTTLTFSSDTASPDGAVLDNVSVTAVPEPAAWAMMIVGFFGLGALLRSRRKSAKAAA